MKQMQRRRFLIISGALLFAERGGAEEARQVRRIGILTPFSERDPESQLQLAAFGEELAKLGWVDGRNASFDRRWAGGDMGRVGALANELVASRPDVILARTTPVAAALRARTREIPIVFVVVSDPLGDGLVESLARPGGNITGFTNVESSFGSKWLQYLREINPELLQVAVMYNPRTAPGGGLFFQRLVEEAARQVSVKVIPSVVGSATDIERSITELGREKRAALIVEPDATLLSNYRLITSLAARHRVPAIYPWVSAPDVGGLMSYGVEYVDIYRRAASYVDRILRGAKPSELPVQQPTKFEFVINRRAAKDLGLRIPDSLLVRADRVIE